MKLRIWVSIAALVLPLGTALAQDDAEIRRELDAQYRKLAGAHDRQDLKAISSLKTDDFHTIGPDGRVADVKTMEAYTKQFIESNKPPYNIRVTIKELKVSENRLIAVAEVVQQVTRMRELAGKARKVETSVEQRETWSKTPEGWKLKVVDNVRNQKRFVDGKRVDPTKPFDPDAPPFEPDSTRG